MQRMKIKKPHVWGYDEALVNQIQQEGINLILSILNKYVFGLVLYLKKPHR